MIFKRFPIERIKEKIIEDEDIYPALFHDLGDYSILRSLLYV